MGRFLLALGFLLVPAVAAAGTPQISATAPVSGLPALSKDGSTFARPVKVQPKGCTGVQSYVELGTVGGKGELLIVDDPCGKSGSKTSTNIDTVNKKLTDGGFKSTGKLESRALPAQLDTDAGTVTVDTGSGNSCSVAIAGSQADKWNVKLDGHVIETRGWYTAKGTISVLVAVTAKDTGDLGRERWVDFQPVEDSAGAPELGSPVEVGLSFVKALAARDANGIEELLSFPFWKVGLKPVTGALKKKCKKLDKARKQSQLVAASKCMAAGASQLYAQYVSADAVAEIDMSEFPDELKKYRKKVASLVKHEGKLVRFHINQDGIYVFLVLVLDPETNYGTAMAVLESIDVDE